MDPGTAGGASTMFTEHCLALRGLSAAGVSDREAYVLRAGEWLRSIQNADGGWGESCESYDSHCFARPEVLPPKRLGQCWASGQAAINQQQLTKRCGVADRDIRPPTVTWSRNLSTGTGFPQVFFLSYHLYRNSFPLLALSEFLKARKQLPAVPR